MSDSLIGFASLASARHTHFFGLHNRKAIIGRHCQSSPCRNAEISSVHAQNIFQVLWDKGEAEGHVHKNAFQDRHGTWHYKELSLVEQTIRQYCTDNGLILDA